MEAPPTGERQLPCGLCPELVPESQFRTGVAKVVQGVLYCAKCAAKAEQARIDTAAFRQSAQETTAYSCARCRAPVPIDDIRAGAIIHYAGQLACKSCARDLRAILGGMPPGASGGAPARPAAPPGSTSRFGAPVGSGSGPALTGPALTASGAHPAPGLASSGGHSVPGAAPPPPPPGGLPPLPRTTGSFAALPGAPPPPPVLPGAPPPPPLPGAPPAAPPLPGAPPAAAARPSGRFSAQQVAGSSSGAVALPPRPVGTSSGAHPAPAPAGAAPAPAAPPPGAPATPAGIAPAPPPGTHAVALPGAGSGVRPVAPPRPAGPEANDALAAAIAAAAGPAPTATATAPGAPAGAPPQGAPAGPAGAKGPPRCVRCRKPLPADAVPGAQCQQCYEADVEDGEVTSAALSLSGEMSLKCAKCAAKIAHADLASGGAQSIDGKLLCRACAAKEKAGPAAKGGPQKVCATCDGPIGDKPYAFAGKPCCAECGVAFGQVVRPAPGTPQPCTACKKPSGEGSVVVDGKVFCGLPGCKRQGEFLALYSVRELRTKRKVKLTVPPSVLAAGVALGFLGLVAYGVKSWREDRPPAAFKDLKPPTAESLDTPAKQTMREAWTIANGAAPTYEIAARNVIEVARLLANVRGDAVEPEVKNALAKAVAKRDAFAPKVAGDLVDKAAKSVALERVEEAIALLSKFPEELKETPPGVEIAKLKDRYQALSTCRGRALALLANQDPMRFEAMDRVAASPEAVQCKFSETPLGERLDHERRRLRNEYEAKQAAPPPAEKEIAADLEKARKAEAGVDLALADKLYRSILARDSDVLEAQFGLARVEIERDRPEEARREVDRAVRIGASRTPAKILAAWLELLDGKPGSAERVTGLLQGISNPDLGRLGRRVRFLRTLAPARAGTRLRVFAPDHSSDEVAALPELELFATQLADAIGLAGVNARIDVFAFKDASALQSFAQKAESAVLPDGRLRGCLGVALVSPTEEQLRAALAAAILARAPVDTPRWLVAGLSQAAAAPPDHVKLGAHSLEKLEALSEGELSRDAAALATARGLCHAFHANQGPTSFNEYVTVRRKDRVKARKDLENFLKFASQTQ